MSTHGLLEISLTGLDSAATPPVISLFDRWGRGGAVVEQGPGDDAPTTIKTYLLPEDENSLRQIEIGLELLKQAGYTPVSESLPPMHQMPQPHIRFLSETDWAEAWKTGYDVLRVGHRLVIKPTWREYTPLPEDVIIALDPGMAFGSGLHPTTRLCLEGLEEHFRPGARVLDVGTGSGILAIAAARLGASQVLALDTDPLAVRVARENVTLNQVGSVVRVELGTAQISTNKSQLTNLKSEVDQIDKSRGWDLVVANILAETIVELAPALGANLAAGGQLIASGIIAERTETVIDALGENGLYLTERRDDGDWVALVAAVRRGTDDG